ncbi:MAG: Translation elongation factor Ts, partial [uncultured Solirubrobacteraceae bacterium]
EHQHDHGSPGQGAPRPHRRRHDGLQEGAGRDGGRHRQGGRAPARQARRQGAEDGWPRGDGGDHPVLHPRQRQGRRADRGQLQHGLRGAQRGLPALRPRDRDARRGVADREVGVGGRRARGRPPGRAAGLRAAGGRQAGEHPRPHRRGQDRQVARGGRPAQPAARQPGQAPGQDDRAAAHGALRADRREHRDPPLLPLRHRRL